MYEEGFQNILNIDYSQIVTNSMLEKNSNKFPNMTCK